MAVLLTPLFMYQADATIVNLANPSIRATLGASGAELELVVGGYLLASATLFITGARLGQALGYRRMFLVGLVVFGLASLACGLAPSPAFLIVARIAQGAGGALLIPQILTGIQLNLEGERRGRALGLYAIALAAGAVAGQILGGVIVWADVFESHWRPVFLINLPITAAVLVAGLRLLPRDVRAQRRPRLDLWGMITLSSALLLIVLPLTLGRQSGWPAWTWIMLAASMPVLAVFVMVERRLSARGGSPLLNMHVLARPAVFWGLWPQAIAVSTYYELLFTLALFLQRGLGDSALVSGLTLVPWVAAFGVPGRLIGRVPRPLAASVAPIGCVLLAFAYLSISVSLFNGDHSEAPLLVLLAIGGFGLGMNFSASLSHLTAAAGPRYASDISGVFTTTLQVAGAIGVAAFGTLYFASASTQGPGSASHAFAITTAAFGVTALLASASAINAVRRSGDH